MREGPLTAAEVEAATRRFKKAIIERALGAELSHHPGYAPGDAKPVQASNHRNGSSGKTVLTDNGPVAIEVPRDRQGTFERQSLDLANWKERKALAAALRPIYSAAHADAAETALTGFEASSWGRRFPTIGTPKCSRPPQPRRSKPPHTQNSGQSL